MWWLGLLNCEAPPEDAAYESIGSSEQEPGDDVFGLGGVSMSGGLLERWVSRTVDVCIRNIVAAALDTALDTSERTRIL